jgi:hypothetical protein
MNEEWRNEQVTKGAAVDAILGLDQYAEPMECIDTIKGLQPAQPTVDPQPQWIPVTERLPEQTGKYLVSVKNGNVYAGTYDSYGGQFQCAAVAWMLLPEPYES